MDYYFSKTIETGFDAALEKITQALKNEKFGVLTEIDIKATLKKKLDVDFKKYTILGSCNPSSAHKALQAEDKIGTMLPCNVIVQEIEHEKIEVAAVNPLASMQAVKNKALDEIATEIAEKLKKALESL